jgi:hypothetical protein
MIMKNFLHRFALLLLYLVPLAVLAHLAYAVAGPMPVPGALILVLVIAGGLYLFVDEREDR